MYTHGKVYRDLKGGHFLCTGGQFMGTYGVSNFWYFREVNPDGSLGHEFGRYGGKDLTPVPGAKVIRRVQLPSQKSA